MVSSVRNSVDPVRQSSKSFKSFEQNVKQMKIADYYEGSTNNNSKKAFDCLLGINQPAITDFPIRILDNII